MKRFLSLARLLRWPVSARRRPTCLAVYQRALQNDPQLKEAEANRLAALESKPQALAALLPQLAGNGTVTKRTRRRALTRIKPSRPCKGIGTESSEAFPSTAA